MLKLYVYCSYRSSPVGFQLGAIDITNRVEDEYLCPTSDEAQNGFIRDCFSEGLVKKAYGRIPDEIAENGKYIYIIKSLEYEFYNEDGMPSKKYGNFAFETDDSNQYNCLVENIENLSYERKCEYMGRFLIPDSTVPDLALKIERVAFYEFLDELLSSVDVTAEETFFVESISTGPGYDEKISERMGFTLVPVGNGNLYEYKKKTSNSSLMIRVLLGTVIGAILILMLLYQLIGGLL